MRRSPIIVASLSVGLLAGLSPAWAHTGLGDTAGFSHGFLHPFLGLDHLLAMVAVGIFAARCGGRALFLVPATFLVVMAAAGALASAGVGLPFAEIGIGVSVVALGAAIASGFSPPLAVGMALVGLFAVFHGHAHGAEMPETASGLAYGTGFVLATAILHAVGLAIGIGLGQLGAGSARRTAQIGGGAIALAGAAILAGFA